MPKKSHYYNQKGLVLGGYALSTKANTAIDTVGPWNVPVTSNTCIIRITVEEDGLYVKYDTNASSDSWDYYIPIGATLDLYNFPEVSQISMIASSTIAKARIGQY